jgi:hypothetical protein
MELGYDERRDRLVIAAHDMQADMTTTTMTTHRLRTNPAELRLPPDAFAGAEISADAAAVSPPGAPAAPCAASR